MTAPLHDGGPAHHDAAGHDHPHVDIHAELTAEQAQLGPSENGSVVLDIGGDFGALILMAPQSMLLDEIEISPVGTDAARTHVAIRERRGPGGTRWAAIYPRLTAGEYTVWNVQSEPADRVTIVGGAVTKLDWR